MPGIINKKDGIIKRKYLLELTQKINTKKSDYVSNNVRRGNKDSKRVR